MISMWEHDADICQDTHVCPAPKKTPSLTRYQVKASLLLWIVFHLTGEQIEFGWWSVSLQRRRKERGRVKTVGKGARKEERVFTDCAVRDGEISILRCAFPLLPHLPQPKTKTQMNNKTQPFNSFQTCKHSLPSTCVHFQTHPSLFL